MIGQGILLRGDRLKAQCSYYASPTGLAANSGLTPNAPLRPQDFWSKPSLPGKTLCLMNGTYTGSPFMLNPSLQIAPQPVGTSSDPVTVRALKDGQVTFNGQSARQPVRFQPPVNWLVLEGFNAHTSNDHVLSVGTGGCSGFTAVNVTVRRVVLWDANISSGSSAHIITSTGVTGLTFEDVAMFGTGRKNFQPQCSSNVTARRVFGDWQGGASESTSAPRATFHPDYNTGTVLVENPVGMWSAELNCEGTPYSVFHASPDTGGTRYMGGIGIVKNSATCFPSNHVVSNQDGGAGNLTWQDMVSYIGTSWPGRLGFDGRNQSSGTKTATRLTTYGGTNSFTASWAQSAICTASSFPGTCSTPFSTTGTNARVCTAYVDGVVTSEPLWPNQMDKRVKDARLAAGREALDGDGTITGQVEALFGTIPAACRKPGR